VISSELDAQPPNAAHSATIPKIRILLIPMPGRIQAQSEVEGNGGATQNKFASTVKLRRPRSSPLRRDSGLPHDARQAMIGFVNHILAKCSSSSAGRRSVRKRNRQRIASHARRLRR
jgi:hypothetical protein